MQAIRPYNHTFIKRKLDFVESKSCQAILLLKTRRDSGRKTHALHANSKSNQPLSKKDSCASCNQSLSKCADTYSSGLKALTCSLSATDLLDHSDINALWVPCVIVATWCFVFCCLKEDSASNVNGGSPCCRESRQRAC
ncbi:hypothetical protein KP509_13G042500 [Ceratopteris richardii]|uniref:Uncharacterized protein n=1 Tax=Ceratopteris richardii TaxID=49495 RepID=A0A8T2TKI7_CERRI|nr:hypothetical protein KP509_13G042500 [Ceratopteris richardii]